MSLEVYSAYQTKSNLLSVTILSGIDVQRLAPKSAHLIINLVRADKIVFEAASKPIKTSAILSFDFTADIPLIASDSESLILISICDDEKTGSASTVGALSFLVSEMLPPSHIRGWFTCEGAEEKPTEQLSIPDSVLVEGCDGKQSGINGQYFLMPQIRNNKPAYRHKDGTYFIYYHSVNPAWMIAKNCGDQVAPAFVMSNAISPDGITETWSVAQGSRFEKNQNIKIIAQGDVKYDSATLLQPTDPTSEAMRRRSTKHGGHTIGTAMLAANVVPALPPPPRQIDIDRAAAAGKVETPTPINDAPEASPVDSIAFPPPPPLSDLPPEPATSSLASVVKFLEKAEGYFNLFGANSPVNPSIIADLRLHLINDDFEGHTATVNQKLQIVLSALQDRPDIVQLLGPESQKQRVKHFRDASKMRQRKQEILRELSEIEQELSMFDSTKDSFELADLIGVATNDWSKYYAQHPQTSPPTKPWSEVVARPLREHSPTVRFSPALKTEVIVDNHSPPSDRRNMPTSHDPESNHTQRPATKTASTASKLPSKLQNTVTAHPDPALHESNPEFYTEVVPVAERKPKPEQSHPAPVNTAKPQEVVVPEIKQTVLDPVQFIEPKQYRPVEENTVKPASRQASSTTGSDVAESRILPQTKAAASPNAKSFLPAYQDVLNPAAKTPSIPESQSAQKTPSIPEPQSPIYSNDAKTLIYSTAEAKAPIRSTAEAKTLIYSNAEPKSPIYANPDSFSDFPLAEVTQPQPTSAPKSVATAPATPIAPTVSVVRPAEHTESKKVVAETAEPTIQPVKQTQNNSPTLEVGSLTLALYQCDGEVEGGIAFNAGDILKVTAIVDENWIEVTRMTGGPKATGIAPVTYVSVVSDKLQNAASRKFARAKAPYKSSKPNGLAFETFEQMEIIATIDKNWYHVRLLRGGDNSEGAAPANRIKILESPAELITKITQDKAPSEKRRKSAEKRASARQNQKSETVMEKRSSSPLLPMMDSRDDTSVESFSADDMEIEDDPVATLLAPTKRLSDPKTITGQQYTALYAYNLDKPTLFHFHAGEILTFISQIDINWIKVRRDNGTDGLAPISFLKAIEKRKSRTSHPVIPPQPTIQVGSVVKGLHDYKAAAGKFYFRRGVLMEVIGVIDQNWLKTRWFDGPNPIEGLAPLNYVELEASK